MADPHRLLLSGLWLVAGCAARPAPAPSTPLPTATYTATEAAFAANRNPLSGLPSTDPAIGNHRPDAFAVVTEPGQQLPAGAQTAEVVVEVLDPAVPGFTFVTQERPGQRPALGPLGPLTARDVAVAQALAAAITAVDAPDDLARRVQAAGLPLTLLRATPAGAVAGTRPRTPRWSFSELSDPRAPTVDAIQMATPAGGTLEWRYDPVLATWRRSVDGRAVTDPATGEPLTAVNVIIMVVPGAPGQEAWWTGSGTAWLLRDGTRLPGRWVRAGNQASLGLVDDRGMGLALRPGNSWWTVVSDPAAVHAAATAGP